MTDIDLSIHRKNTKEIDITKLSQDAFATGDRLEVQEIIDEKVKIHQKMMEDIIDNHRNYDPLGYYILVLSKNDYHNPNVIKTKYIVRSTKPRPDWNQDLYYYSNQNEQLYFIYSLPKLEDTLYFRKNYDLFKVDWMQPYMKAIDAMIDGSLVAWDAPCSPKHTNLEIPDLSKPGNKIIL